MTTENTTALTATTPSAQAANTALSPPCSYVARPPRDTSKVPCRYGALCNRSDCGYLHAPSGSASAAIPTPKTVTAPKRRGMCERLTSWVIRQLVVLAQIILLWAISTYTSHQNRHDTEIYPEKWLVALVASWLICLLAEWCQRALQ